MSDQPAKKIISRRDILFTLLSFIPLYWTIKNSGLTWGYLALDFDQWCYFTAAVGVLIATIWVQSLRVKIPWETWPTTKEVDTLNGLIIGNFYNCILPGNLGEGVRAWHFKRKNKVPFIAALASIGVEKYIDAFNFIVYSLVLALLSVTDRSTLYMILLMCLAVSSVFILYIVIIYHRGVEKKLLGTLLLFFKTGKWLYSLHYHIKGFLKRMSKEQIIRYLVWGYLMFALNIFQYYLVMKATHIPEAIVTFRSAFLVAVSMVVVCIVPSAPGNIGVLHFGIYTVLVSTLVQYGISPTDAVLKSLGLYTVYLHFSYFLPEIILGGVVLIKERKWVF